MKKQALLDCLAIGGFCLLLYGLWLVHPAAAFIVGGALLITYALITTYQNPHDPEIKKAPRFPPGPPGR